MNQRIMSGIVVVVGVVLIGVTIINSLFAAGSALDDLTDDFRPHMTDEAIEQYQADLALLGAVPEEFNTTLAPTLAGALGMDAAQLNEFVEQQFPDVANGLAAVPEIVPAFQGLVGLLDAQQENFVSADTVPAESLPAITIPWVLVILGILFVALGALMYKGDTELGAKLTAGLAVVVIAASLILSLLGKAGDTDDLNDALEPVYTVETIEQGQGALVVVGNLGNQLQTEMVPALAEQLGMTPEDVGALVAETSPTVGQALQTLPDALGRFGTLLGDLDANLDNYGDVRPVSLTSVVWTLLIGSIAALAAAAMALAIARKEGASAN